MDEHLQIISADWVFPVHTPPIHHGAVVIHDGSIMQVGRLSDIGPRFGGVPHEHIEHAALLPGLVNAHTHLELGYLRGKIPPSHFVDWVVKLITLTGQVQNLATAVGQSVREGIAESLHYGVTTLGDITRQVNESRVVARDGPARIVSFGEVQALGKKRSLLNERLYLAADPIFDSATLRTALSPHAPYTVEGPALQQIVAVARERQIPLCMHLAELPEEKDFLRDLSGRIREAWDTVGIATMLLDDQIPLFVGGPIKWAERWGLLEQAHRTPVLLAHVNYATEEELTLLAARGVHVAYCPRTRERFGHDEHSRHPFAQMLNRGINVCLATDSLASNPDLSLLREAELVARKFPGFSPLVLLEMITTRPARALGLGDKIGALMPGMVADMIALPLGQPHVDGTKALEEIMMKAPIPERVWMAGRLMKTAAPQAV